MAKLKQNNDSKLLIGGRVEEQKKEKEDIRSKYEKKADYFSGCRNNRQKKRWYKENGYMLRLRIKHIISRLISLKLPFYLSWFRWILVDFLRGKETRFKGIYQFIGLPGEGKTISMVAHIRRTSAKHKNLVIATNFNYCSQTYAIEHWIDIVKISLQCYHEGVPCLIAIDEIQNTFDATDYKNFPPSLYSLLTFNRKLQLQFIVSAQIYERIPSKIRGLANYTVICKNVLHTDRYFINYYFEKNNYETQFDAKRKHADFIRKFIADDDIYNSYDTFQQVERIQGKAEQEKDFRKEAFELLFGSGDTGEAEKPA